MQLHNRSWVKTTLFAIGVISISSVVMEAFAATNPLFQPTPSTTSTASKTTTATNNPSAGDTALSNNLLAQIKTNTDLILSKIDKIPELITNLTSTEEKGKQPDPIVFNIQSNLSPLGQFFQYGLPRDPTATDKSNADNIDYWNNYLIKLQKESFAASQTVGTSTYSAANFENQKNQNNILSVLPNVNELAYTNTVGLPPLVASKQNPLEITEKYIRAASGADIFHSTPPFVGPNPTITQKQYQNYFNLAYAVQSFNSYVLGKYLFNADKISQNQSALYGKASNSSYLANIAVAPIGHVLRDILLFQSQNYVLTNKLVELQREILISNAMTNALLIVVNRPNESALYEKSQTR